MAETIHDVIIEKIKGSTLGELTTYLCAIIGTVCFAILVLMEVFFMTLQCVG